MESDTSLSPLTSFSAKSDDCLLPDGSHDRADAAVAITIAAAVTVAAAIAVEVAIAAAARGSTGVSGGRRRRGQGDDTAAPQGIVRSTIIAGRRCRMDRIRIRGGQLLHVLREACGSFSLRTPTGKYETRSMLEGGEEDSIDGAYLMLDGGERGRGRVGVGHGKAAGKGIEAQSVIQGCALL